MAVPIKVYQGTTFAASIFSAEYPPADWDGELRLTQNGETDISIFGTDSGDGKTYKFAATPAETKDWPVGDWSWVFLVSDGTDTMLLARGGLTVAEIYGSLSDLQSATATLKDVRAALAAATGKPSSYSIKDRSLTNRTIAELLQLESYWARRAIDLQNAEKSKPGNRRITYARFV